MFWGCISSFPAGHSEENLQHKSRIAEVHREYRTVSLNRHFRFISFNFISGLSGVQPKAVAQSILNL